jgi:protein-L-isoaspartate(D-aspartate) O-methyltransferase
MGNYKLIRAARNKKHWLQMKKPRSKRVLKSLSNVDRINFLTPSTYEFAYEDTPIDIGYGGTCSQPSLVALMADLLELRNGHNVLEIGSGCGYSAAVTYELIKDKGKLTTIEIVPQLSRRSEKRLTNQFGDLEGKIELIQGDGSNGHPKNGPYDRIYMTAAPSIETFDPYILMSQLSDKGILLFPSQANYLHKIKMSEDEIKFKEYYGVLFVNLKGENK